MLEWVRNLKTLFTEGLFFLNECLNLSFFFSKILGGRALAVHLSTKEGLPTERHPCPGNASSCLEGAFPLSYK